MINSASVSKDGRNVWTRGHPSRRGEDAAPQDEVGDFFTASEAGALTRARGAKLLRVSVNTLLAIVTVPPSFALSPSSMKKSSEIINLKN
jgi:hypothetical protein